MTQTDRTQSSKAFNTNLWIVFSLLIPLVLLAFGPSYFSGETFSGKPVTSIIHVHAALMMLWIIMLVGQAFFIRTKRYALHRRVGRSSFVIAPVIIVVTLIAVLGETNITATDARIKIFGLGITLAFAVTWGLAIIYRRKTPVHVRFIVSTVFAMASAIVFRILRNWFSWVPGLDSTESIAIANALILLLPLLALIMSDWRAGMKCSPFWVVATIIAFIHIGYFTFAKSDWWMEFVLRITGPHL